MKPIVTLRDFSGFRFGLEPEISATLLPGRPQSRIVVLGGQRYGSSGAGPTLVATPALPLSEMPGARKPRA